MSWYIYKMSRDTSFSTWLPVRTAKTQINLRIRAVWFESSQGILWVAKDPKHLQADSEDSDQTARMRRLIWVFAARICSPVGNSVPLLKLYPCMFPWQWNVILTYYKILCNTCSVKIVIYYTYISMPMTKLAKDGWHIIQPTFSQNKDLTFYTNSPTIKWNLSPISKRKYETKK